MATKLSADELLNRALLAILHGTADSRLELDIRPELPWPESRDVCEHFQACPDATVSDVASRKSTCGNDTCNVAIINATVQCPHQAAAPAQLDTYGHLVFLMEDMHRIGQEAIWRDEMDDEDESGVTCERCTTNRAELWRLGLRREPYCRECSRSVPGVYAMIVED